MQLKTTFLLLLFLFGCAQTTTQNNIGGESINISLVANLGVNTSTNISQNAISLHESSSIEKYGLVEVLNNDGSLNRQYKISAEDLAILKASGNGVPPNCTRDEWESGRAKIYGKTFEVGDAQQNKIGQLIVKYAEDFDGVKYTESYAVFDAGQWSGTVDAPSIDAAKVVQELGKQNNLKIKTDKQVVAIVNGTLSYSVVGAK